MKIRKYIRRSIIYGKPIRSRQSAAKPVTVNVRGVQTPNGSPDIYVAHQNNTVGWTPTQDVDFIFVHFANVVSTSTNIPGVYTSSISIPATWSQVIQSCGRAGRQMNSGGFCFTGPVSLQSTLRFTQHEVPKVHELL